MPFDEFVSVITQHPPTKLDKHLRPQHLQIPEGSTLYQVEQFQVHWMKFRMEIGRLSGRMLERKPKHWNATGEHPSVCTPDLGMVLLEYYRRDWELWSHLTI